MADNNQILPYPFNFSSDQWANTYSPYAKKALPFMGQYAGVPTDAHGNPIQSYLAAQSAHDAWQPPPASSMAPATTLNSTPQSGGWQAQIPQGQNTAVAQPRGGLTPQQWQALSPQQQSAASAAMAQYSSGLGMMPSGNNFVASGSNPSGSNPQAANALAWMNAGGSGFNQMGGARPAAPAAPAPPTNPVDMNAAYLQALANPGRVQTPGANVPQSAPPSNQSGVLQQFLQNWQGGGGQTRGAGNYDNSGFFKALQGQV